MSVEMTFESMDDFSPAAVARKGVVRHCDVPDRRHYGFKGEFRQWEDLLRAITQPSASSLDSLLSNERMVLIIRAHGRWTPRAFCK